MARVAGLPGRRQRHSLGGPRGASAGLIPCLLLASPKTASLGRHPPPPAPGSGPSCPGNSFPSERKCFVLFLFVSYPTACWFSVHFSNIHHLLACVCVCVHMSVCARAHVCVTVRLSLCVFPDGREACCANAALCPGQPLVPPPVPALTCPRLLDWGCGLQEPLVPAGVHAFEDVET